MTETAQHDQRHDLTVSLDERQNRLMRRLADQMGNSPEEAALAIINDRLKRLARQGPGLTTQEIEDAVRQSDLDEIVMSGRSWHPAYAGGFPDFDQFQEPERNQHGEMLLALVNFAVPRKAGLPYSHATFEQDSNPPHHWRAWFETIMEDDGELGDLPEDVFPHPTVRAAADNLAAACRERFPGT